MPTGLLRKHCASLTHSDGGWLLTYPIVSYCEYGERVPERIDIVLPIVAENYAGRLQACQADPARPQTAAEICPSPR